MHHAGTRHGGRLQITNIVGTIQDEAAGPSYTVVRLCDRLLETGHDVSLLTVGLRNPNMPPARALPNYCKELPPGFGPWRLGRSPAMWRLLAEQAAAGKIDILHNHGLWMMPNVYPGWIAQRGRIPLVVSPRGSMSQWAMASGSKIKRVFWPLLQRPSFAKARCFHATSHEEYEDVRRLGFRQPVAVIPNGIDLPELKSRQRGERRTLLFLARIHPKKGLDLLLPAWSKLEAQFPQWDLKIVGSTGGLAVGSNHLSQMQAMVKTLGLSRVTFHGPSYGAEKFDAFRQADLYILPTYSENFGVTVAEALSQETAVIVTKGAPWEGLLRHKAGWWTDIGIDPLVSALGEAMSKQRDVLDEMGRNGRQWMQKDFTWGNIADQMSQVYNWITGRSDSPSCVILN